MTKTKKKTWIARLHNGFGLLTTCFWSWHAVQYCCLTSRKKANNNLPKEDDTEMLAVIWEFCEVICTIYFCIRSTDIHCHVHVLSFVCLSLSVVSCSHFPGKCDQFIAITAPGEAGSTASNYIIPVEATFPSQTRINRTLFRPQNCNESSIQYSSEHGIARFSWFWA